MIIEPEFGITPPLKVGDRIHPRTAPEPPVGTVLRDGWFTIGRNESGWWSDRGQTEMSWRNFGAPYTVLVVGE